MVSVCPNSGYVNFAHLRKVVSIRFLFYKATSFSLELVTHQTFTF